MPGGFGIRGIEGNRHHRLQSPARDSAARSVSRLQCVVIEAARSVGLNEASSTEFDPDTKHPVISTMADQEHIVAGEADLGGRCAWVRIRRS